jgi:hypothetical protein
MYGIVNKAIEELLTAHGGIELWHAVCEEAGVEPLTFIAQESYPDCITFGLVQAASKKLGMSPHDVLVKFGEHWSIYTGQTGYGHLFKMLGEDLMTFLDNLPELHDHVAHIFPDMKMPHFETERVDPQTIRVLYRSERTGLAPMVLGLLEGMAKIYNTQVRVSHSRQLDASFDADEFFVTLTDEAHTIT